MVTSWGSLLETGRVGREAPGDDRSVACMCPGEPEGSAERGDSKTLLRMLVTQRR